MKIFGGLALTPQQNNEARSHPQVDSFRRYTDFSWREMGGAPHHWVRTLHSPWAEWRITAQVTTTASKSPVCLSEPTLSGGPTPRMFCEGSTRSPGPPSSPDGRGRKKHPPSAPDPHESHTTVLGTTSADGPGKRTLPPRHDCTMGLRESPS